MLFGSLLAAYLGDVLNNWNLFLTLLPSPGCLEILKVPFQGR